MKENQVIGALVSTCFGRPQVGHTIKTNLMKLQAIDPEK